MHRLMLAFAVVASVATFGTVVRLSLIAPAPATDMRLIRLAFAIFAGLGAIGAFVSAHAPRRSIASLA